MGKLASGKTEENFSIHNIRTNGSPWENCPEQKFLVWCPHNYAVYYGATTLDNYAVYHAAIALDNYAVYHAAIALDKHTCTDLVHSQY